MNYFNPIPFYNDLVAVADYNCFKGNSKYDNQIANIKAGNSVFLKFNIESLFMNDRVGIKFVNNSARNYFVLIHSTQQQSVSHFTRWSWSMNWTNQLSCVNQLIFKWPLRWKRMVACKRGLGSGPLLFSFPLNFKVSNISNSFSTFVTSLITFHGI